MSTTLISIPSQNYSDHSIEIGSSSNTNQFNFNPLLVNENNYFDEHHYHHNHHHNSDSQQSSMMKYSDEESNNLSYYQSRRNYSIEQQSQFCQCNDHIDSITDNHHHPQNFSASIQSPINSQQLPSSICCWESDVSNYCDAIVDGDHQFSHHQQQNLGQQDRVLNDARMMNHEHKTCLISNDDVGENIGRLSMKNSSNIGTNFFVSNEIDPLFDSNQQNLPLGNLLDSNPTVDSNQLALQNHNQPSNFTDCIRNESRPQSNHSFYSDRYNFDGSDLIAHPDFNPISIVGNPETITKDQIETNTFNNADDHARIETSISNVQQSHTITLPRVIDSNKDCYNQNDFSHLDHHVMMGKNIQPDILSINANDNDRLEDFSKLVPIDSNSSEHSCNQNNNIDDCFSSQTTPLMVSTLMPSSSLTE